MLFELSVACKKRLPVTCCWWESRSIAVVSVVVIVESVVAIVFAVVEWLAQKSEGLWPRN